MNIVVTAVELLISIALCVFWSLIGTLSSFDLFVAGTIFGFTVITAVFIIAKMFDVDVDDNLYSIFAIAGFIFSVVSGIMVIAQWHDYAGEVFKSANGNANVAGIFLLVNSLIFLLDSFGICGTTD